MTEQEQLEESGSVVVIKEFHCLRCGWKWNGRPTRKGFRPACCAYCKSSYWDRPGTTKRAMSPEKFTGKRRVGTWQSNGYRKQNYQLNRLRYWIRKLGLEVARLELEKMEFAEGERRLEIRVKKPETVLIPPPPGIHGS